jgi:hypothetical protein
MDQVIRGAIIVAIAIPAMGASSKLAAQTKASGASAKTPHACRVLSQTEIARITGRPGIGDTRLLPSSPGDMPEGASGCGYLGEGLHAHVERLNSVPGWSAAVASEIKQGKAQKVTGIGDEAVFKNNGTGGYALTLRVGANMMTYTVQASDWGSQEKVKGLLQALGKAAAPKLR